MLFRSRAQDNEQVESERREDAGESMFLGEHREDEIVVGHRQEAQLPLRSLGEPLPPQPAGADGDAGLDLLVPGPARILRREADNLGFRGDFVTADVSRLDWHAQFKNLVFRTPATTEIAPADYRDISVPSRLFKHAQPTYAGVNVYKLTDGSYTEVEQRNYDLIEKVYWGGTLNVVTQADRKSTRLNSSHRT